MTYSTVAIIYNPNSTGPSKDMAKEFAKNLRARLPKQKIELIATKHAGHAEELAYSIAKKSKNPLVISSSGDGGYNELINGAMKAQHDGYTITTSLLPAGNANDHFRNLNTDDLVDLVARDKTRKIDLLKLKSTAEGKPIERYAHSYIGIGLTPKVGKELNKSELNLFTEVWLVTRALLTVRPVRLKLGNKVRRYESVIFSNVDQMSKYMKISQPSKVNDGTFEVTIFRRSQKLKLILLLLKASVIGVKENTSTSKYSLETVGKTLIQADGEIVTVDGGVKVEVTAEKRILRCII